MATRSSNPVTVPVRDQSAGTGPELDVGGSPGKVTDILGGEPIGQGPGAQTSVTHSASDPPG